MCVHLLQFVVRKNDFILHTIFVGLQGLKCSPNNCTGKIGLSCLKHYVTYRFIVSLCVYIRNMRPDRACTLNESLQEQDKKKHLRPPQMSRRRMEPQEDEEEFPLNIQSWCWLTSHTNRHKRNPDSNTLPSALGTITLLCFLALELYHQVSLLVAGGDHNVLGSVVVFRLTKGLISLRTCVEQQRP